MIGMKFGRMAKDFFPPKTFDNESQEGDLNTTKVINNFHVFGYLLLETCDVNKIWLVRCCI